LHDQLRASYAAARNGVPSYPALAERARQRMHCLVSADRIAPKLSAALDEGVRLYWKRAAAGAREPAELRQAV
jgi:hypothetical protein